MSYVTKEDIKIENIFDFTSITNQEQEIYKFLYNKAVELSFTEDNVFVVFDGEELDKTVFASDNLPFCLIEAGEMEYNDTYKKRLDGVLVSNVTQSFYIGFFNDSIPVLQNIRENFIKALYVGGFNSALDTEIYYRQEIDSSLIVSREDVQRKLKNVVFKINFSYNIYYRKEEALEYVDVARVSSDKYSEVPYAEVTND